MHRLAQCHGLRERHRLLPVVRHAHLAIAERELIGRRLELLRDGRGDHRTHPRRGLDRRHAAHQRHTRRVRAEVDGREARVRGMHVNVLGVEAQDFGRQVREDRIGALADVGRAAQDRHATAAVPAQDHP